MWQAEARFFEAAQFEGGRRLEPMIGAEAYAQVQASLRQREGRLFVAVGVDHLHGGNDLLQLLQKQGYRVTPVY